MARPYCFDLRERVVSAGQPCRAVAKTFGISVSAVVKWSQRFRTTGSAAAKKMGGHRQLVLARQREWLLARVRDKPDITMRELAAELAERGIVVSHAYGMEPAQAQAADVQKNCSRQRAGSP